MLIKLDELTGIIKVMQRISPWSMFYVNEIGDWFYAKEYFYD